jgi:ABC-2 type transport system permease protein
MFPEDVAGTIESNRHAMLTFYHQEIDPFEATYVEIVARQIADETNEQLLLAAVQESQDVARSSREEIQGIANDAGSESETSTATAQAEGIPGGPGMLWLLLAASEETGEVSNGDGSGTETPADGPAEFDEQLTRFIEMNPSVIVEPFRHETQTMDLGNLQPAHFYVPAVLALLVQHIAVSLAGLSLIRERLAGSTELMRAAPLRPVEALIGKYLSFLVMLGLVAAVLTALVVFILKVPLSGSLGTFALILFLFISLYRLWWPAQVISWAMPATYGIRMLQDTMLRGIRPEGWLFWVLGGAGVALFIINWLRLRRLMAKG